MGTSGGKLHGSSSTSGGVLTGHTTTTTTGPDRIDRRPIPPVDSTGALTSLSENDTMRPASLARLIAGTNRPANQQAESEPTQLRKLAPANKADSDTKAAPAAFNEHDVNDQSDGPHGATDAA